MAVDGSLIFDTKINGSGFEKGANRLTEKASATFKKIGVAIAAAFSVATIVNFSKKAIESASDLEEAQNVVDTAFGKTAYKMEEFANKALETYGISKLVAKQTGSTVMAMAKGMNIAEESASDMAIELTGLSADMASFYNVEQEVASTALKSIFTGETETLKQFGVVMTEANLSAFALSQGINKDISAMSQAEKVQLRYNYVMSQTSLAQGDFAKTSEGWANQTRISSEKWKELSTIIGKALKNIVLPAVRSINTALTNLIDITQSGVNKLAKMFGWDLTDSTSNVAQNTQDIATSIEDSTKAQDDLTTATKKTNKELKNSLATFDELNVLQQDTVQSTVTGTGNIDTSSATATGDVGGITKKFEKAFAKADFKALGQLVADKLNSGMKSIKWDEIHSTAKSWASNIADFLNGSIKKFNWKLAGKTLGNAIKTAFIFAFTLVKKINWKKVGHSIVDLVGGLFGSFKIKIPTKRLKKAMDNIVGSFRNFYNNFLKPLGKWTIEKAVPVVVDLLAKAFEFLGNALKVITSTGGIAVLLGIGSALLAFKSYTAVSGIITGVTNSIKGLGSALTGLSTGNIIGIVVSAIAGLVIAMKSYHDVNFQNSTVGQEISKLEEINSKLQGISDGIQNTIDQANSKIIENMASTEYLDELQGKLQKIIEDGTISADEQAEAKTIVSLLKEQVPDFEETWNTLVTTDEKGNFKMQQSAQKTTEAIEKTIEARKKEIMQNALAEVITETYKECFTQQEKIQGIKDKYSSGVSAYEQAQQREKELTNEINELSDKRVGLIERINELKNKQEKTGLNPLEKEELSKLNKEYEDGATKLQGYYDEQASCRNITKGLKGEYDEYKNKLKEASGKLNKLKNTTDTYNGYLEVMNGNYNDLASVYGAYESGLIDEETILKNTSKTAKKLNAEMKGTGDEAVRGYLNALSEGAKGTTAEAAGLAEKTWKAWREQDEIHSPSKKYESIGKDDIAGFVKAFDKDKTAVKSASTLATKVTNKFKGIFENIKLSLKSLPEYFSNLFKKVWSNIKTVLNNSIIPGSENFINSVNEALNNTINKYNKSLGGKTKMLLDYPAFNKVKIPRLATGTVVPASYGEFLAVLGDNKRETEVVSPLSTIKQAVAEVMAGNNGFNGDIVINFTAELDGDKVFNKMVTYNNRYKKRHGKSPF